MKRALLIVDDIRTNREILKKLLGDEYRTFEACDGREALTCLRADFKEISAVLLDLSMPVMDGFAVLAEMRKDPQFRQIPVIVTTGQTEDASEVRALQMGADDYVSKPYTPAVIKQRVSNAINLRETAATVNELRRDRLTGLLNRTSFFEKAAGMISGKEPGYYVMACFDIDGFKVINDLYGTEKGDFVLRYLAAAFSDSFGDAGGICCRMMADVFAVLYPCSFIEPKEITELRRKVTVLDGSIQPISFSIGRYIVDDLSLSVSAMYDRASLARDTVKGRYDRNIAVFDESMRDELIAQRRLVTEMKPALEKGEFEPWFQPQYNHATGSLTGAEALTRWRHPEKGMIAPGEFIPVFEKNRFIYELDKYIWERVCGCLHKWISEGRRPLPVSVNISRYDIFMEDLIGVITGLVQKYEVPVELLRLEITESAFARSTSQIIDTVKKLVSLGFTVEIDDFGSGYSSLNTLKDVPAQIIKLDMKFLESYNGSERGGNILESVVRMAKWLDMAVIAEGVETKGQADFLRSIGCFYIQGYLYAKPMPQAEYEALAARSEKQHEIPALETVENLDNNTFWNPESMDTLIFNSYLGGAGIFEFCDGRLELLRANTKFTQVLSGVGMKIETALKLNWTEHMESDGRERLLRALDHVAQTGAESTGELLFHGLPGCAEKVYLRSTMRVIAKAGPRLLIYCAIENITAQRTAEQKRQEATDQLTFLESVASRLLTQPDTNAGIHALLEKMLKYFGGDRCYIFEFDFERQTTQNTYELCAAGVVSEMEFLSEVPLDRMPFWMHAFDTRNYIEIKDTEKLGADRPEKELLQKQGIQSLIAVPLRSNGKYIGFIGIDNPKQKQEQISSLTALGDYTVVLLTRRNTDEQIARENREKVAIMDGIPGGFVRMQVKPDGTVVPLYFSEGLERLLGMNQEQLTALYGNDVMAGVHPDDLPTVKKEIARMISVGEGRNIRYRLQKGGGGYIWVMIFGKAQKNRSGETYLNIYYTDATEQKKLDDIRTELLDNLPCGAALYEIESGNRLSVIQLNRHYWELVGRTPVRCENITVTDAIYPEDRKTVAEEISAAINEKRDIACNIRILCGDGSYRMFGITGRIVPRRGGGKPILCAAYTPVPDGTQYMQQMLPVILSAIMESTSDYSFIKDKNFRYICASNAFAKMTGQKSARDIIGKTDYDLFEKELADKYRRDDEALLESNRSIVDMLEAIPAEGGKAHYSSTSKYLLRDGGGNIIGMYGTGHEITEYQSSFGWMKLPADSTPGGAAVYECTRQGVRLLYFNDGFCGLFGCSREEYARECVKDPMSHVLKEDVRKIREQTDRILDGAPDGECMLRAVDNGGKHKCIYMRAKAAQRKNGTVYINTIVSDVTEQQEKELIYKKWQQSLRDKAPGDYTLLRCNISKDMRGSTREGELLRLNFDTSALTFGECAGKYGALCVSEEDMPAYTALMNPDTLIADYYRGIRRKTLEYREKQADGSLRWLSLTAELVGYPDGTDVEAYLMFENIDREKREELMIREHAQTDPLTGILNRAAFAEKTESLLSRRGERLCALFMLDIDNFKQLNDSCGHIAGDRALIAVADKLRSMLHPADIAGRLGGDEFLVCSDTFKDRAAVIEMAETLCSGMQSPAGQGGGLAASIGISVCPDDGGDFETLYRKADKALYRAKREGKNRYALYSGADDGGRN